MARRHASQLRLQPGIEHQFQARTLSVAPLVTGVIIRQCQRQVSVAQVFAPVRQLRSLSAGLQPAALPHGVVAVLNRQWCQRVWPPLASGLVLTHHFLDQQFQRPTIGHDMVSHQQQHMLLRPQFQQFGAQQRALGKVERLCDSRLAQRLQLLCLLGARQGRHVMKLDAQAPRRVDPGRELTLVIFDKNGAQGFMACNQSVEGRLQCLPAQFATQAY